MDNNVEGYSWYQRYWRTILVILLIMGGTATIVLLLRHPSRMHEIIIITSTPQPQKIEISVSGEVAYPGIYLVNKDNTIADIVDIAGGNSAGDYSKIVINLSPSNSVALSESQKININIASEWLLDALPGIGAERAKLIIDYRKQNGLFKYIEELKNVPGIGDATFDGFRDLITVN